MRARGRHKTPLERAEYAIIVSSLLFMVVVTLQPLLNLLAISLSDPDKVAGISGFAIIPRGLSTEVWRLLIQNPAVRQGVVNSIFITGASTALGVMVTALMAWALAQPTLPGRRMIFILTLVTIVFDPGIIPDYFVNRNLGLIDSYWSVIFFRLVNAWYLIILIRFFEEVPKELLETAELDGAGAFRIFWHVALPLAKSALATITLFYFVFHWNEFFRAMIYLNDQTKWPLQLVLRQFVIEGDKLSMVGIDHSNHYTGAAQINIRALKAGMIILTILPVLVIYPVILRFFAKGAMSGALKG